MNATDWLVTLLLACPFEVSVPRHVPACLFTALKKQALVLEVVGPHERWRDSFQEEYRYVYYHWRELRSYPSLADCVYLPSPQEAKDGCCYNLTYQRYLKGCCWLRRHHWYVYHTSLEEAQALYLIWEAMAKSVDSSNSWAQQRRSLNMLRELLGPEAYAAGQLPPAVPLWRFVYFDGP